MSKFCVFLYFYDSSQLIKRDINEKYDIESTFLRLFLSLLAL